MLINDTTLPEGADPTNQITGYGNVNGGAATSNVNPDLMSTLQSTLMSQSGMISSNTSGLDAALNRAVNSTSSIADKNRQLVQSQYDRQSNDLNTSNQNAITSARERGVGVNVGDIAYKTMAAEADKSMKDLQQRKDELLLQNDMASASKINDLIFQTQKMKTDAMQQTFTNMLALGNFGLQQKQEQRAQTTQDFTQKSAIASIGLEYGIAVSPKDTLETIIAKAAPLASKTQAAKLAGILAENNLKNAQAANYMNGVNSDKKLATDVNSPLGLASIVRAWELSGGKNSLVDQQISKNSAIAAKVYPAVEASQNQVLDNLIAQAKQNGWTPDELNQNVNSAIPNKVNPSTVAQKVSAYQYSPKESNRTAYGDLTAINQSIRGVGSDIASYFGK